MTSLGWGRASRLLKKPDYCVARSLLAAEYLTIRLASLVASSSLAFRLFSSLLGVGRGREIHAPGLAQGFAECVRVATAPESGPVAVERIPRSPDRGSGPASRAARGRLLAPRLPPSDRGASRETPRSRACKLGTARAPLACRAGARAARRRSRSTGIGPSSGGPSAGPGAVIPQPAHRTHGRTGSILADPGLRRKPQVGAPRVAPYPAKASSSGSR